MTQPSLPVPLTILTGFLGAGKTTLLNHILRGDHGLRVAVLVNDFGAINIDAELVVGVEDDMVNLANGCICCSLRDDLLVAVLQLLNRPAPPEYILIEASGVSHPVAIAGTFLLPELRDVLRLDATIAVVDAEQALDRNHFHDLVADQITAADLVVLNKVDLVDQVQRAAVMEWIRATAPRARVLEARFGAVPLPLLLDIGRYRIDILAMTPHNHSHHDHNHDAQFASWHFTSAAPLALDTLRKTLRNLPLGVVRAKGWVWIAEAPERRALVQVVGRRVSLTLQEQWGDALPQTRLVAIGAPRSFDAAALDAQFAACCVELPSPAETTDWQAVRTPST